MSLPPNFKVITRHSDKTDVELDGVKITVEHEKKYDWDPTVPFVVRMMNLPQEHWLKDLQSLCMNHSLKEIRDKGYADDRSLWVMTYMIRADALAREFD